MTAQWTGSMPGGGGLPSGRAGDPGQGVREGAGVASEAGRVTVRQAGSRAGPWAEADTVAGAGGAFDWVGHAEASPAVRGWWLALSVLGLVLLRVTDMVVCIPIDRYIRSVI